MSPITIIRNEETGESRATLACYLCRRRKIRCTRELPRCATCEQTSQQCAYPERILKPGPKLGSTQISRKRKHNTLKNHREHTSPSRDSSRAARENSSPSSPPRSTSATERSHNIQSLSFIVHPSHESCSPEVPNSAVTVSREADDEQSLLTSSCSFMGIDPVHLDTILDEYFDTFTSFQLFRKPYLREKLESVPSALQIQALLAAMLSFIVKKAENGSNYITSELHADRGIQWLSSRCDFLLSATELVDQAVKECGDEPLSLTLLQALILVTHGLLIQGVRGRAWRHLGLCVRSAYELNLHLVDSGKAPDQSRANPAQWCKDEERRRAWWAIWEMDVFASVIRRCPAAIDWSQNETFLPTEDEKWFRGEPHQSCLLETNLVARWRALEVSGNQCSKAWFIVINSLMKEAQKISSPIAINKGPNHKTSSQNPIVTAKNDSQTPYQPRNTEIGLTKEALDRLTTVENCLHCVLTVLPKRLRYDHQHLCFGTRDDSSADRVSKRFLHSSIYSIHLMAQLTRLMTYKYYVFRAGMKWLPPPSDSSSRGGSAGDSDLPARLRNGLRPPRAETQTLHQYLEAADEVVAIVRRSSEDHHIYVNPFLANTIWIAGAAQLLRRELAPGEMNPELIQSSFELLCLTYRRFTEYWSMSSVPQKNLATLEIELERLRTNTNQLSKRDNHLDTTSTAKSPADGATLPSPVNGQRVESHHLPNAPARLNQPSQLESVGSVSGVCPAAHSRDRGSFHMPASTSVNHGYSQSVRLPSNTYQAAPDASIGYSRQEIYDYPHQPQIQESDPLSNGNGARNTCMPGTTGIQTSFLQQQALQGATHPRHGTTTSSSMEYFGMLDSQIDMTPGLADSLLYDNGITGGNNSNFSFYLDSILSGADITSFDV